MRENTDYGRRPEFPENMKYGSMIIGISNDGDRMNNTSSACPFVVTVLNTNHGGMDAADTIMYMFTLEVSGPNRNTKNFMMTRHHLYQKIVVSVFERTQSNGVLCSLPTGVDNTEETWTLLPVVAVAQFDTKGR